MRKLLALAASAALATVALGALSTTHAGAQCPGKDGSLPNTPARVYTVGPFYIDDRDYPDLNENDDSGGIWVYMESGVKPNLQRGGDQLIFTVLANNGVDPKVPFIAPIKTGVKNPSSNKELILFPNGFGGGSLAQLTGFNDDCVQDPVKANRDVILF